MRIACITQWWPPEGATIVSSLARELSRRDHDVEVVTGFPNYPSGRIYDGYRIRWRQIEHSDGLRTIRVPLYPSHDRVALKRVASYASFGVAASTIGAAHLRRPDVAYVYHPPITSAWPALVLRRLRGVPFVLHIQDLWPESVVHSGMVRKGRQTRGIETAIEQMTAATYRAAAHIVVISPGLKEHLVARGVDPQKVSVIMNWADEDVFKPTAPDPAARAEIGPKSARVVLYAGNFGDYQGLDAAIRAASGVRHRGIHLTLVGDGLARPDLERLIEEIDAQNVSILPARPAIDMRRLLAAADAHLVSLLDLDFFSSTIPGKTQVALAMGRPVIMAVRGDAAALIDEASAGFTCEPGENGMQVALGRLADCDSTALEELGARGRRFYEHRLALAGAAQEFESVMATVVDV